MEEKILLKNEELEKVNGGGDPFPNDMLDKTSLEEGSKSHFEIGVKDTTLIQKYLA